MAEEQLQRKKKQKSNLPWYPKDLVFHAIDIHLLLGAVNVAVVDPVDDVVRGHS